MRRVLPLLAVLSLAFAPAPVPRPDTKTKELKALQGVWHRVSMTHDDHFLYMKETPSITIAGRRMKYTYSDSDPREWEFTINSKENPNWLDRKRVDDGHSFRGIYQIEKEKLTVCSSEKERPASFDEKGLHIYVEVFQRKRP